MEEYQDVGISALNLLTVPQVAMVFQCSRSTVWRLIKARELVPIRIGRIVRVTPQDLTVYIKDLRARG